MKSLLCATAFGLFVLPGLSSAATVNSVEMKQNDWIVFDSVAKTDGFTITPGSTNGSFSYTYGFSDSLCPQSWACMPESRPFNTVQTNGGGDFGYGWSPQSFGSVVNQTTLATTTESNLYLFFRVTSGSASVSWSVADTAPEVAPVPLPAPAILLLAGIGGLATLRRRKKQG